MDKNKSQVKVQKKGKKEIAKIIFVGFLLALIPFIIISANPIPIYRSLPDFVSSIGYFILIFFLIYAIIGAVLYSNSISSKFGERKGTVRFWAKSLIAGAVIMIPLTLLFPYALSQFYHPILTCGGGGGGVTPGGGHAITMMCKPAIYLYPEKSMPVQVNVEIQNGYFTKTDPQIDTGNGWDVIANPNGEITQNGRQYHYLFYEAVTAHINGNEGWVVKADKISSWFDEMLPKMGLNEKEKKDFTDYWNQNLPKANYYRIRLLTPTELDNIVKLNIQPKPDTVIRVILVIEKLDEPVGIAEQKIITPERKGFTAVEWGVILQ